MLLLSLFLRAGFVSRGRAWMIRKYRPTLEQGMFAPNASWAPPARGCMRRSCRRSPRRRYCSRTSHTLVRSSSCRQALGNLGNRDLEIAPSVMLQAGTALAGVLLECECTTSVNGGALHMCISGASTAGRGPRTARTARCARPRHVSAGARCITPAAPAARCAWNTVSPPRGQRRSASSRKPASLGTQLAYVWGGARTS